MSLCLFPSTVWVGVRAQKNYNQDLGQELFNKAVISWCQRIHLFLWLKESLSSLSTHFVTLQSPNYLTQLCCISYHRQALIHQLWRSAQCQVITVFTLVSKPQLRWQSSKPLSNSVAIFQLLGQMLYVDSCKPLETNVKFFWAVNATSLIFMEVRCSSISNISLVTFVEDSPMLGLDWFFIFIVHSGTNVSWGFTVWSSIPFPTLVCTV